MSRSWRSQLGFAKKGKSTAGRWMCLLGFRAKAVGRWWSCSSLGFLNFSAEISNSSGK